MCAAPGGGASHNFLSATHLDTTTASPTRGAIVTGQTATPVWQSLVLGGGNLYLKSDGTDLIYSTLAASGVGSCTNQFATALNADAAPTCSTATLASAQFANQGTTTTLLHGNGAGNPSFGAAVSADLNITTTSCTNQFVTAISSGAAGTCTTATLAGAQFANQGTTTTLLHGNAAGNPSFGAVGDTDIAAAAVDGGSAGEIADGTVDSNDLATANKTLVKSITILDPTTGETNQVQWYWPAAVTLTKVECSVDAATSVTIQLDERAVATPNTAGVNSLTGTLACDIDSQSTTSFSDSAIAAAVPHNLQITAVSGTIGAVRIHVTATIN